jgi:hypothetical protein
MAQPAPPTYRRVTRGFAVPASSYPDPDPQPLPGVVEGQSTALNNASAGFTPSRAVTGEGGFSMSPRVGTR